MKTRLDIEDLTWCPRISGTKTDVSLEYGRAVRRNIVRPLLQLDGVAKAVEAITEYDLLREDLESLGELTAWTGLSDDFSKVDSKVGREAPGSASSTLI